MKKGWVPQVGDEVYLRSGSQRMVIERIVDQDHVGVIWMKYGVNELVRDTVPILTLDFKNRRLAADETITPLGQRPTVEEEK